MTTNDEPIKAEQVAYEICQKEAPISETTVPEATDYSFTNKPNAH